MALAPGTRIGVYEIVAPLGAGGMGEVHRARDTRLGRAAALKTLPPEFALDPERRARFEREAKTLATLNHPHIAQIYGLEDVQGADGAPPTLALAMELVEGEDLAQRIARGTVALDEAWPLARQIAEGLEAAHEAGIVHRDLKPANIRVTPDGVVKVLDFGLAKPLAAPAADAADAADAPPGATHSPTVMTSPAMTLHGVILGTAAYMAPEQARGRPVDRRADIWAFGCVLYELLTGKRAFEGEDVPEILSAIIKSEPDWAKLPAATPARVRTLLSRCLAKDRTQRLQHIGDARLDLSAADTKAPGDLQVAPRAGQRPLAFVAVGVVALGVGLALGPSLRPAPTAHTPPRAVQFDLPIQGRFALSPDGQRIAYLLADRAASTLWVRDLSAAAPEMIGPTDGGAWLDWRQDGTAVYVSSQEGRRRFAVDTRVMTRERNGSPLLTGPRGFGGVALLPDGRMVVGATQNADDKRLQLWAPDQDTPLGDLDTGSGELRQAFPALWNADLVTYSSVRERDVRFLCATRLSASRAKCAGPLNQTSPTFYVGGRVFYARDRTLLTRGFDLTRFELTTDEEPLAGDLALLGGASGVARLSVGEHTIAFAVEARGDQLEWHSPSAPPLPIIEVKPNAGLALSPDGRRTLSVVAGSLELTDLANGSTARLGRSGGDAIWAPDGRRLAHRAPDGGLLVRSIDTLQDEVIVPPSIAVYPEDWSRDGRWIVAVLRDGPTRLGLIPATGGEMVGVLPAGGDIANADEAHFSPDGQ